MEEDRPKYTKEEILIKAASYCAYQERCHQELIYKLNSWGWYGFEADAIVSQLIEQNYINEERFAITFAGGKHRVKKWGKLKIKRELRVRGISDYCIQKALNEIDSTDYYQTLNTLVQSKLKTLENKNPLATKQKLYNYLATKGYESDLIWDCLNNS